MGRDKRDKRDKRKKIFSPFVRRDRSKLREKLSAASRKAGDKANK